MKSFFTPDQVKELAKRSEERDTTISRESEFSHGEDDAMQQVAQAVEHEAAITAAVVEKKSDDRHQDIYTAFNSLRRKALVAFLVLAIAIGYALVAERRHSNANRAQVAAGTRIAIQDGCKRNNILRTTLRGILLGSIPQTIKFAHDHHFSAAELAYDIKQTRSEAMKLNNINCSMTATAVH